jgi:hypothetical protein
MDYAPVSYQKRNEVLAKICHEAIGAFRSSVGLGAPPFWGMLRDDEKADMVGLIETACQEDSTAESVHEHWIKRQTARGWAAGDKYNKIHKTDPWLVEYIKLPRSEKLRYVTIVSIVKGLSDQI